MFAHHLRTRRTIQVFASPAKPSLHRAFEIDWIRWAYLFRAAHQRPRSIDIMLKRRWWSGVLVDCCRCVAHARTARGRAEFTLVRNGCPLTTTIIFFTLYLSLALCLSSSVCDQLCNMPVLDDAPPPPTVDLDLCVRIAKQTLHAFLICS